MRETLLFDQLFRQYYQPLLFFSMQYIADEEECHDIVSAVFEEVWKQISTIDEPTAKAFLYTSVRNRCIDHLRKQKLRQEYVAFSELMSERYIQEDHGLEQQDDYRIVGHLLDSLKQPTRAILEACYLQEKKYREVAEEMNISISTVKKHMVKALKLLREYKKTLKT